MRNYGLSMQNVGYDTQNLKYIIRDIQLIWDIRYEMWGKKCEVQRVEYRIWGMESNSVTCRMWNTGRDMRCKIDVVGVRCRVLRKNNGTWDEECRIRNTRREILDLKYKIHRVWDTEYRIWDTRYKMCDMERVNVEHKI